MGKVINLDAKIAETKEQMAWAAAWALARAHRLPWASQMLTPPRSSAEAGEGSWPEGASPSLSEELIGIGWTCDPSGWRVILHAGPPRERDRIRAEVSSTGSPELAIRPSARSSDYLRIGRALRALGWGMTWPMGCETIPPREQEALIALLETAEAAAVEDAAPRFVGRYCPRPALWLANEAAIAFDRLREEAGK